jgi:hypothetical protein
MQVTYYDEDRAVDEHAAIDLLSTPGRSAVITGLRPGEPVFVIRAQDALGVAMINLWREMAYGLLDDARADQVEVDLQAFIEWRHGPGRQFVKDPD